MGGESCVVWISCICGWSFYLLSHILDLNVLLLLFRSLVLSVDEFVVSLFELSCLFRLYLNISSVSLFVSFSLRLINWFFSLFPCNDFENLILVGHFHYPLSPTVAIWFRSDMLQLANPFNCTTWHLTSCTNLLSTPNHTLIKIMNSVASFGNHVRICAELAPQSVVIGNFFLFYGLPTLRYRLEYKLRSTRKCY